MTPLTHWSWITLPGLSNNAASSCCQWAGCTGGLWRRHDTGENMQGNGTFISSRNLVRRQDGMTSSASLQQWLYTRASHLCNCESCWVWTKWDRVTMCKMRSVPFSHHIAHVQCHWGRGKPCRLSPFLTHSPTKRHVCKCNLSFQHLSSVLVIPFFPL